MRATVDFKWNSFARRLFYGQFVVFLCFLGIVVAFSLFASRTAGEEAFPTMRHVWHNDQGRVAIFLAPISVLYSFFSLFNELQQLLNMGAVAYFDSIW